jgi:hypothetical protein
MDYQFILSEHGRMHPDFFQGTTGVQINLYVLDSHTKGDAIDMLEMELNFHYDSIVYMFERKGKLPPGNIEEKLALMISELKGDNDLTALFSSNGITQEELDQDSEEIAPFIFSINIDFFE